MAGQMPVRPPVSRPEGLPASGETSYGQAWQPSGAPGRGRPRGDGHGEAVLMEQVVEELLATWNDGGWNGEGGQNNDEAIPDLQNMEYALQSLSASATSRDAGNGEGQTRATTASARAGRKGRFKCWQCGSIDHPSFRCEGQLAPPSAEDSLGPAERKLPESDKALLGNHSGHTEPHVMESSECSVARGHAPAGMQSSTTWTPGIQRAQATSEDLTIAGADLREPGPKTCEKCRDWRLWGECEENAATHQELKASLMALELSIGSARKSRRRNRSHSSTHSLQKQSKGHQAEVIKSMVDVAVNRLCKKGHRPRLDVYMVLVDAFVVTGRLTDAEELIWDMRRQGVRPDAVVFNAIINAWCELGHCNRALRLLLLMLRVAQHEKDCNLLPTPSTFNTIIKGLGVSGRPQDATQLLRSLLRLSSSPPASTRVNQAQPADSVPRDTGDIQLVIPMPTIRTFNIVVNAWCQEGEVEEARAVMRLMRNLGVPPDAVTYNTLLTAYSKLGRPLDCERVLREMANAYIRPTERTFAILISALCDAGKMRDAHLRLRRMQIDHGVSPNAACFNSLIRGFTSKQLPDQAELVLLEMQEMGVAPDVVSYSTIMDMWAARGATSQVQRLLLQMQEQAHIQPDVEAYSILAKAFLRARDGQGAESVLEAMKARGVQPNVVTYTTVISTWCSMGGRLHMGQALGVLQRMVDDGVLPNVFTLRTLLWGLAEARMPHAADQLLHEAESKYGVRPDARCLEHVAAARQAAGLPARAARLRHRHDFSDPGREATQEADAAVARSESPALEAPKLSPSEENSPKKQWLPLARVGVGESQVEGTDDKQDVFVNGVEVRGVNGTSHHGGGASGVNGSSRWQGSGEQRMVDQQRKGGRGPDTPTAPGPEARRNQKLGAKSGKANEVTLQATVPSDGGQLDQSKEKRYKGDSLDGKQPGSSLKDRACTAKSDRGRTHSSAEPSGAWLQGPESPSEGMRGKMTVKPAKWQQPKGKSSGSEESGALVVRKLGKDGGGGDGLMSFQISAGDSWRSSGSGLQKTTRGAGVNPLCKNQLFTRGNDDGVSHGNFGMVSWLRLSSTGPREKASQSLPETPGSWALKGRCSNLVVLPPWRVSLWDHTWLQLAGIASAGCATPQRSRAHLSFWVGSFEGARLVTARGIPAPPKSVASTGNFQSQERSRRTSLEGHSSGKRLWPSIHASLGGSPLRGPVLRLC